MTSNLPMQAQLINEASNSLESLITRLWEEVFGLSAIGPQDDFFQLGGNSLHAARLVAKIRALTGRDLPLESFLYAPTIERLALLMRGEDDHLLFHSGDPPRGHTRAAAVYRS